MHFPSFLQIVRHLDTQCSCRWILATVINYATASWDTAPHVSESSSVTCSQPEWSALVSRHKVGLAKI